ncbi:hypothetical protein YC2023_123085 [Brassica napus]
MYSISRFLFFKIIRWSTVRVICDHVSGKSKGYGFVLFDSEEAAASALASMNNQLLEGRQIRVEYARPKGGLDQNPN